MDINNVIQFINRNIKPYKGEMYTRFIAPISSIRFPYSDETRTAEMVEPPYYATLYSDVYIKPTLRIDQYGLVAADFDVFLTFDENKTFQAFLKDEDFRLGVFKPYEEEATYYSVKDLPKDQQDDIRKLVMDKYRDFLKELQGMDYSKRHTLENQSYLPLDPSIKMVRYFENQMDKYGRLVGLNQNHFMHNYNLHIL